MNTDIGSDDPTIYYYDSDYPSRNDKLFPENFDSTTEYQGVAYDVERYIEVVAETGDPVLELCCGTGRVAIPLARSNFKVTGVDVNSGMITSFRKALEKEEQTVAQKITLIEQDVTKLSLDQKFPTAIFAFNSLLCIPDFNKQISALHATCAHPVELLADVL